MRCGTGRVVVAALVVTLAPIAEVTPGAASPAPTGAPEPAVESSPGSAPAGPLRVETLMDTANVLKPAVRQSTVKVLSPIAGVTVPDGKIMFPLNPCSRFTVLDNFGDSRSGGRSHEAVDIMSSLGQPVYAVVAGTLYKQVINGPGNGGELSGNAWWLRSKSGERFFYAHLSAFAPDLKEGSTVAQGELIGFVGDTGNPGPGNYHLHFGYFPASSAVDPYDLLFIPKTGC